MDYSIGTLTIIFVVAAALSVLGAWLLAWRFRAAMRVLMSRPVGPPTAAYLAPTPLPATLTAPAPLSAADNRRAGWRLAALLVALSALISLSSAVLQLGLAFENLVTPGRTLTMAFAYLWPVIPVLGQMWRWSRLRLISVLLLWGLFAFQAAALRIAWSAKGVRSATEVQRGGKWQQKPRSDPSDRRQPAPVTPGVEWMTWLGMNNSADSSSRRDDADQRLLRHHRTLRQRERCHSQLRQQTQGQHLRNHRTVR